MNLGVIMLDKLFKLTDHKTTVKTEVIAGLTTFLTMAYVLFATPSMMEAAGMPPNGVFIATALAAALGCFIMGFWANFPGALAPGMGLNAFFAFAVVGGMGYSWQEALGAVFISGVIFFLLSAFKIREWIITSIPNNLRHGITVGIGLFLTIIAFKQAGVIVSSPATIVALGDFTTPGPILASLGFLAIIAMTSRKITGSVLWGILGISIIAYVFGLTGSAPASSGPEVSATEALASIFGAMTFDTVLTSGMLAVIFAFVFVDLFDTSGTLMATASQAGLADKNGQFPAMGKAMMADSTATTAGAIIGVPSVTTYVESASGIAAGGRTGLTAVIVGLLFLAAMPLVGLIDLIPAYATAPALLFVGVLMTSDMKNIDWDDLTEATPAWIAAIGMPLFFSISHGIGMGFLAYTIVKLMSGRYKDLNPALVIVSIIYIYVLATAAF
jgi:AGZA family xanthine/uracil permease-like MFS transporter